MRNIDRPAQAFDPREKLVAPAAPRNATCIVGTCVRLPGVLTAERIAGALRVQCGARAGTGASR